MSIKQPQSIDMLSTITSDALEDTDFFIVETGNGTRKIDYENMKSALGGGGDSGIALDDVSGAYIGTSGRDIYLRWTDPNDVVLDGITLAEWEGTKIVRKEGMAPANRSDGVVVLDSKVRNQYAGTFFVDEGLEYGTLYYYKFFPYTTGKKFTSGTALSESPKRVTLTAVPSQLGYLNYDGTQKTAVFNNYNSSQLTVTGNKGTNAGSYTAVFTPKEGYCWPDGSTDSKTVIWSIQKRIIHIPTVNDNGGITYPGGGREVSPGIGYTQTVDFNERDAINTSDDIFGSDAGTYTITFSLKDTENYQWEDGTINDKSRTWTIKKKTVSVPSVTADLTYNGSQQSPTISSYSTSEISISGNTGTNAGTYTVTFSLVDTKNYQWSDSTTANKTASWTIKKADGSFTISKTSIKLDETNSSDIIDYTIVGDGTISITNSNSILVDAKLTTLNGKSCISINLKSEGTDTVIITVSLSGTSNYNAPNSQQITVTTESIDIVSWENGTDEQVVKMVQAAGNGTLDLTKYWSVGDKRKILLDAIDSGAYSYQGIESHESQYVEFVLLHKINKSFYVGMVDNFKEPGIMCQGDTMPSSSEVTRCSWAASTNTIYSSLPSSIRPIFKRIGFWYTYLGKDDNEIHIGSESGYFGLFREFQVRGAYGTSVDLDENEYYFEYFQNNISNLIHKNGYGTTETGKSWWLADVSWSKNGYAVADYIDNTTTFHSSTITNKHGICVYGGLLGVF